MKDDGEILEVGPYRVPLSKCMPCTVGEGCSVRAEEAPPSPPLPPRGVPRSYFSEPPPSTYHGHQEPVFGGVNLDDLSLQDLQARKRELKQRIKQYDANVHGRKPAKEEKEPIWHLYENYNTLKAHIICITLSQPSMPCLGSSAGSVDDSAASDVSSCDEATMDIREPPRSCRRNATSPSKAKKRTGNSATAIWKLRYGELVEYKKKHGDCIVPQRYEANNKLGNWVHTQRHQYHLFQKNMRSSMTTERIDMLEELGFSWVASHSGNKANTTWNQRYGELRKYKQKHGDCNVPVLYEANKQLGKWVANQRQQYRRLRRGQSSPMTTERIDKLDELGFPWNASHLSGNIKETPKITWNQRYKELIEFKEKHGDCNVPNRYEANKQLGQWVNTQRQQYRLLQEGMRSSMTEERITKLNATGFTWKLRSRKKEIQLV